MQKALHYLVNSIAVYGTPDYDSANLILGLGSGREYDIKTIFRRSRMIRDEFDALLRSKMNELGMDESYVLSKLKDAIDVAESRLDASNMIKGVVEVGKLLRMYPDQKINQRGLSPAQQQPENALPQGKSLLDEVREEWQDAQVISDAELAEAMITPKRTE